jgi:hypothetical protein
MVKQAERREISQGVCRFCRGEFAKNKMTQHLKSCKARVAHKPEQDGQEQRLLHVLVEGKHRPEYWLHLEVPAVATLDDLDMFLRAIWLECCSHLSEFEIDGVSYSSFTEDGWELVEPGEEEEEEGEEGEAVSTMEDITTEISLRLATEFHADLKDVPVQQIEEKLVQLFTEHLPGSPSTLPQPLRPVLSSLALSLQKGTLLQDLQEMAEEEEEEDVDMDAELGDVLSVGTKFSYMYDFGSTSTLSLRVIAEREGVLPAVRREEDEGEADEGNEEGQEDEDEIVVLARNEPPSLVCHLCGQPATYVPSRSEYDSLTAQALCTTHARESENAEELLPLVNSPRTGICAYMGDAEMDWEDDDWEEDEDEDEDE